MNDTPKSPEDLNSLINQASTEVHQKEERVKAAARRRRIPLGPILLGLLAVGVAFSGYILWARFAPPTAEQAEHDLNTVVESAHDVVEHYREKNGQLPDALPSAALASVVRYQREDGTYRLTGTLLGIRITLEADGNRHIEHGVEP